MIFNQVVIGEHPATSGYKLDFFANGFDGGFASGSGQYTVDFPNFGISSLNFKGKESIFDTTVTAMSDIDILENEIVLSGNLTGDFNNSGILNVKNIDVYTGTSESFACDTIDHSNRVLRQSIRLENTEDPFVFTVTSGDITGRVEENIFYKLVPADFLIGRNESSAISGIMAGDLGALTSISGVDEFIIKRETASDLFISEAENAILVFPKIDRSRLGESKTTIIVNDNVPFDFEGDFVIKYNGQAGDVVFTTESLPLSVSNTLVQQNGIGILGRQLIVSNRENSDRGFSLAFSVDNDGNKTALVINADA
jgi:hypothetical protein